MFALPRLLQVLFVSFKMHCKKNEESFFTNDTACVLESKSDPLALKNLFLQSCEQHQMSVFFMLSVFPVHLCWWKIFSQT